MISVTKALNALQSAGMFAGWTFKRYTETGYENNRSWREPKILLPGALVSLSDETYGRESYLYMTFADAEKAREAAKLLRLAGGKPRFSWCPDNPASFDLRVNRFKGFHWWE